MDVIAIVIQVGVVVTPLLVFVYLMKMAQDIYENSQWLQEKPNSKYTKEQIVIKLVAIALFLFSFAYVVDIVLKFRASV